MKRQLLALLCLPSLSGCALYGAQEAISYASNLDRAESLRLGQPPEIMWSEATYNAFGAHIVVKDPRADLSKSVRDTLTVRISSSTDPTVKSFTLTETSPRSGIFVADVALVRSFDDAGQAATVTEAQILVNADQDAARLEAVYAASAQTLKAQATYVEPPMHFGIARDADGVTPLPGASITIDRNGIPLRTTVARADGSYAFYGLPSGSYTISVTNQGAPVGQSKVFSL